MGVKKMDFTNFNKVVANFKNAKKDLPFKKANEVNLNEVYRVNGIFSVNGKFGIRYFVSLSNEKNNNFFNFDLPTNQNENAKAICSDVDSVNAINNGECGIIINTYHSKKYNRECVYVEWVNITPF